MKQLKDHIFLGLAGGLILPTLAILIFYGINFSHKPFLDFLTTSVSKQLLSPLLSLCVVMNLALFYFFLRVNYLYACRGVIMATLVYGLVILLLKFAQ